MFGIPMVRTHDVTLVPSGMCHSMHKLSWILKKQLKMKSAFFSKELTFQPTRCLTVAVNMSSTFLAPLQVWETVVTDMTLLRLPIGNVW